MNARASESLPVADACVKPLGPAASPTGRVLSYQRSVTATTCHAARVATLSRPFRAAAR